MKAVVSSLLFCLVLMFCPMRGFATTQEPPEAVAKTTFLVIYRPGPAWLPGKRVTELPLKAHGNYMLSLFVKGSLKFAGPLGNDAGGAVMLEVANEAEAKAIVAEDPAVKSGLFVHEIHQWGLVQWEKYLKKPASQASS